MAYEREFGILGQERGDAIASALMALIATVGAGMAGSNRQFTAKDFAIHWKGVPSETEYRQHSNMRRFDEMAAAMGWQ